MFKNQLVIGINDRQIKVNTAYSFYLLKNNQI